MYLPTIFLLFVAFQYHLSFGQHIVKFYVHPNGNSSQCPADGTTCLTLYEYVASIEPGALLGNASIYYFLPGIHSLNVTANLINGTNVTFQGMGEMREGPHETVLESPAVIHCDENITIHIEIFLSVQLSNLTLKNCGKQSNDEITFDTSAVSIIHSRNVMLDYISIQGSPGGALATLNIINCEVFHSSFYSNNLNSSYNVVTVSYGTLSTMVDSSFVMNCSNITNNEAGLLINLVQNNYHVNISLESLLIANNSELNVYIMAGTGQYNLSVNGLVSSGSIYGFFLRQFELMDQTESLIKYRPSIFLSNCSISHNQGTGMIVVWFSSLSGTFCLDSSSISHNVGVSGSALLVSTYLLANSQSSFDLLINNTVFDSNTINLTYADAFAETVAITNCRNMVISNCNFTNNEGSSLVLIDTYVTFYGVNNFTNNSALVDGGGIYMISTSILFLTPGSLLWFANNHANDTGGAIRVEQIVLTLLSDRERASSFCFYQLQGTGVVSEKHFHFESNTARVAGTVLYGGETMSCLQEDLATSDNQFINISTFVNQSGLSVISSDPRGVCFCNDSVPDCSLKNLTMNAIPGGSIGFSVIVIGQQNNATTGFVSISSDSSSRDISSALCTNLSHQITVEDGSNNSVMVNVTLGDFETNFFQSPLTIYVDIQPCLHGTYLSPQSHVCECEDSVKAATTNCDGVNATVTKEGTSWIGEFQNCTIVYNICPYDYCIPESVTYPLSDPDRQCALNRSGLLCGECDNGLSLMLGSNKCGQCNNGYLALIIPFSLAGIALVVLLVALNLTVTVGTINGLLFFANLFKIYEPLLSGIANVPVLSQFISWINLDLGIETCFFVGMNSCYKTLLQFIFPFYLWFLIILIILLSRRFSKLSHIIGNNAVPVLCTLLLLSYTKILRTIVSIFIFAKFSSTCPNAGSVWFNNGEPYFTGCHLGLFIIAFPALIVLFLPYTLFLLLFPLWELCRSKWTIGTSLFLKLKPFFDAYAGPHTDQFRVWPGLLLLARIVLAIAVAAFPVSQVPLALLVATTTVLIATLSFGLVYKNKRLHSLDIFYLLCLLVIFNVVLGAFIENGSDAGGLNFSRLTARIGVGIVSSISFVGFLAILAYHVYIRFPWSKIKEIMEKHKTLQLEDITPEENLSHEAAPKLIVIGIPELREPLLESVLN